MRIKNDFVTNSSSTCFLFAFKGETKKDLYQSIMAHEMTFWLSMAYDGFHSEIPEEENNQILCSATDVINALRSIRKKLKVISIDEKIEEIQKSIKEWGKHENMFVGYIYECFSRLAILLYARERGINKVVEVCFGDNDGPFAGTKIGLLMDYEGRDITLYSDDLIVLTEQRR